MIFTVTFFLLLLYVGFTTFIRQHSIWITPSFAGPGSSGYPSVFPQPLQFLPGTLKKLGDCGSGVFRAEEVDGVGGKGAGDTIKTDIETFS